MKNKKIAIIGGIILIIFLLILASVVTNLKGIGKNPDLVCEGEGKVSKFLGSDYQAKKIINIFYEDNSDYVKDAFIEMIFEGETQAQQSYNLAKSFYSSTKYYEEDYLKLEKNKVILDYFGYIKMRDNGKIEMVKISDSDTYFSESDFDITCKKQDDE